MGQNRPSTPLNRAVTFVFGAGMEPAYIYEVDLCHQMCEYVQNPSQGGLVLPRTPLAAWYHRRSDLTSKHP